MSRNCHLAYNCTCVQDVLARKAVAAVYSRERSEAAWSLKIYGIRSMRHGRLQSSQMIAQGRIVSFTIHVQAGRVCFDLVPAGLTGLPSSVACFADEGSAPCFDSKYIQCWGSSFRVERPRHGSLLHGQGVLCDLEGRGLKSRCDPRFGPACMELSQKTLRREQQHCRLPARAVESEECRGFKQLRPPVQSSGRFQTRRAASCQSAWTENVYKHHWTID